MKKVFQKWINAAEALLEMIIMKLPSPVKAQKYRCAYLYEGPQDDVTAKSIQACDPKGELSIFISISSILFKLLEGGEEEGEEIEEEGLH